MGNYPRAMELYAEALEKEEKLFGAADAEHTAVTLSNYGNALREAGKYIEHIVQKCIDTW